MLEEKGIPYRADKVPMRSYGDKPEAFLRKVPSGLLPAIELDGKLYTESLVIMQLLEESFPGLPATLPPRSDAEGMQRVNVLLKLERELFSWWCTLTFRRSLGSGAENGFSECLDKVEKALSENPSSPWLVDVPYGGPSFVDFQYVSHVERMAASCVYWKGFNLRNNARWPCLENWFRAFEARPQYVATKSDYYTHCQDIPPQYGDGVGNEKGAPVAAHIDGTDGSWTLPLPPLTATSSPEPYFLPAEQTEGGAAAKTSSDGSPVGGLAAARVVDEEAARHEAALRLIGNHEAVLRFCCRGAGVVGRKRFQAPLADPYAIPSDDIAVRSGADLLLRCTVARLLDDDGGSEDKSGGGGGGASLRAADVAGLEEALSESVDGGAVARGVRASASYLRDRIGVPRDMSFPAARQLRAHLNWAMAAMKD